MSGHLSIGSNVDEVLVDLGGAPGGSQPAPGSSVLWAGAELTGQASGTYPGSESGGFEWVQGLMVANALPASAGSDLAINGGDATLIDVLTDSWVTGLMQVYLNPETAPDTLTMYEATWGVDFLSSALWPNQQGPGSAETSDAYGSAPLPMPVIFCPAGTQIRHTVAAFVSNPAHTWRATAWLQLEKVG